MKNVGTQAQLAAVGARTHRTYAAQFKMQVISVQIADDEATTLKSDLAAALAVALGRPSGMVHRQA